MDPARSLSSAEMEDGMEPQGIVVTTGHCTHEQATARMPAMPQQRLGRRLEGASKAVGGGYCPLQMPLRPALDVAAAARHCVTRPREALKGCGGL